MISSNEVIHLINRFSLTEKLLIVEEILKNIREENAVNKRKKILATQDEEPSILRFAGTWDEEEADVFESGIIESRKIDENEW